MKKTEEKVIRFISSHSLIEKDDKVLVALSGGPDSVFLLHFLNKFKKKYKIKIGAFHLNHKLRGKDADADERFCRQLCIKFKVNYYSSEKDVDKFAKEKKVSVEEAGRIIRYNLLTDISKKHNYTKIATAHIQEDNTETVFLNLIKGSGLTGMSGIPVRRDNIIRPVLCLNKDEILDYLHFNGISFRIDESNLSEHYERNYLRQQIIPLIKERLNPSLGENILNSSLVFQSLKQFIDEQVKLLLGEALLSNKEIIKLKINLLNHYHKSIATEAIKNVVREKWNVILNYNDLTRILELLTKQTGLTAELSENIVALKDRESLIIKKKSKAAGAKSFNIKIGEKIKTDFGTLSIIKIEKKKISYSKNPFIEYISGDNIQNTLTVKKWQNGDRFFPLGMKGEKKVSDFLIDIKMNRLDKQNQLVLTDGNQIIWVIGKRIDNRYKVTERTKKVLELCWNPNKKL